MEPSRPARCNLEASLLVSRALYPLSTSVLARPPARIRQGPRPPANSVCGEGVGLGAPATAAPRMG